MSGILRYDVDADARAAVITLDRPDVRNALDLELYEAILDAAERAAADDAVRSVILTGAGDRAFSAGADM
ncbi:MAG TPA: enoyl-CoA hydratase-related protein, partial [Acidimicrobiia bacterium]|nr:enoyl-CoA hydratase-related protein [Acidimicrobiia bacterium]